MRIAHVSVGALPPVWSGGGGAVQRRVGELALAQAALGHEVLVVSPDRARRTAERSGVRVEYLACRAEGPVLHWEFLARARRVICAGPRPDVVHVHNEPEAAAILNGLAAAIVLSYDNFYFRQRLGAALHSAYRRLLLRYDVLLPVSRYCARESTAHWRLPPDKVRILPNGVSTEQFAPRPYAGGGGLLYLGRICRQKGTHVLLDAYAQLREPAPLVLAGPIGQFHARDGTPEATPWQAAFDRVGATYLGRVEEEQLAGLLSSADVFVMPTVELEMQGMAALEAQACGTPVVATDHGGLPETVPDECGIRVPPGDATALAEAIRELLGDDQRRSDLGRRARRHAESYAWPVLAERSIALYREALIA